MSRPLKHTLCLPLWFQLGMQAHILWHAKSVDVVIEISLLATTACYTGGRGSTSNGDPDAWSKTTLGLSGSRIVTTRRQWAAVYHQSSLQIWDSSLWYFWWYTFNLPGQRLRSYCPMKAIRNDTEFITELKLIKLALSWKYPIAQLFCESHLLSTSSRVSWFSIWFITPIQPRVVSVQVYLVKNIYRLVISVSSRTLREMH